MRQLKGEMDIGRLLSGCALSVLSIGLAATAASAQQTPAFQTAATGPRAAEEASLQEVVVTARRREENVQRVPVSVSVVSSEQLTTKGVNSAADLV